MADDFHVFAVEWSPETIAFYVDQTMYVKRTRADLKPDWQWIFDKPFFVILNPAVGGTGQGLRTRPPPPNRPAQR